MTELLDAAQALQGEREQVLADAQREIEQLRSAAVGEIDASLAAAREERARGYAQGLAQGLEDAANQWTESALREAASARRSLMRQTHRLSQIVSLAVAPIIEHEDRVAMFNRTLKAVAKLVRDVPMATMRVSPSELGSARSAVTAFAPCATGRLQIEVKGDSALQPGSCLFESDQGVIDAGLKTQLAAIQRAMDRAAQHMVLEPSSEPAPADEALDVQAMAPGGPQAQGEEQHALVDLPGG